MSMTYMECFRFLASRRSDQWVVTSAGNSGQAWWAASRDSQRTFYLDASMSLATLFTSGMAMAQPSCRFWGFMGDGAFCMNPGMLMVERDMNLANVTHFLLSNRAYGATFNARLPNGPGNDYAAIARGMGLTRVYTFSSVAELEKGFDAAVPAQAPGHTFIVLEMQPFSDEEQKLEQPPFDGPEMKYLFGRTLEKATGTSIIGYKI